jgi:tetratricopeptide (TPR) repeat protein
MSIAYAFEENIPEAQKLYEELLERSHKEFIGGMSLFITGFSARNYDQAFEHLEKAIEQRDSVLVISKVWPFFTSFRKDPRFNAAIKKINFPEPSRAEPSGTLAAV